MKNLSNRSERERKIIYEVGVLPGPAASISSSSPLFDGDGAS